MKSTLLSPHLFFPELVWWSQPTGGAESIGYQVPLPRCSPPCPLTPARLLACACWEVVAGRRQGVGSNWSSDVAPGTVSPGEQGHTQAVLRIHRGRLRRRQQFQSLKTKGCPWGITPGHCPHLLPPLSFVKVCCCLFWRRS